MARHNVCVKSSDPPRLDTKLVSEEANLRPLFYIILYVKVHFNNNKLDI